MNIQEVERLAVVETKLTDLDMKVGEIAKEIREMRLILSEVVGTKKSDHIDYDRRLARLERQSNMWKWMGPTLSAVVSAVMTFLVLNYLDKL